MEPQTAILIGLGSYFVTLALNRFLGERSYKSLSQQDKTKLIDEFSLHRSVGTYVPIAIMACVIGVAYYQPASFRWLFPVGIVLLVIASLVLQLTIFRHLGTLGLPENYAQGFRIQAIAVQVGNVFGLAMLAYGIVRII